VAHLFQVGGLGGPTVTVNANSLFDLNGYYQSLTTLNLRDGGRVTTGVGLLDFPLGGAVNVGSLNIFGSHASSSITGAIGLPPNASLSFNVSPYSPGFPFASGPELDVLATIPRPVEQVGSAPAGITKNGLGQMRLGANNTYAGGTFINGGTLLVDGTQPQSLVAVNSGTLGGSGTVGDLYMTGSSAVVAPGDNGPGILTCSNLNAGITASGVLRMELNGTTPGSGYDQLNVRGTVNLAGVVLQRPLGFSAPFGAQFDIINNDGSDAVTGTFNGLADGGKLYIGGTLYQINYRFSGRPGNDVALQGLDTPPPPTLVIEKVPPASVRLIWPTNDPPFSLQANTNLSTPTWITASPPPAVLGTNNVVTNALSGAAQFYRLVNP
jgi:autotransporter-associated beta strand protein